MLNKFTLSTLGLLAATFIFSIGACYADDYTPPDGCTCDASCNCSCKGGTGSSQASSECKCAKDLPGCAPVM